MGLDEPTNSESHSLEYAPAEPKRAAGLKLGLKIGLVIVAALIAFPICKRQIEQFIHVRRQAWELSKIATVPKSQQTSKLAMLHGDPVFKKSRAARSIIDLIENPQIDLNARMNVARWLTDDKDERLPAVLIRYYDAPTTNRQDYNSVGWVVDCLGNFRRPEITAFLRRELAADSIQRSLRSELVHALLSSSASEISTEELQKLFDEEKSVAAQIALADELLGRGDNSVCPFLKVTSQIYSEGICPKCGKDHGESLRKAAENALQKR